SGPGNPTTSAEIYDSATGSWTTTGPLHFARSFHTATLLPSGQVLVAGGASPASAEIYDPVTQAWVATGPMTTVRFSATATLLSSGKVLVAGGSGGPAGYGTTLASAEVFDPGAGTWSSTGSLGQARFGHAAVLLADGKVLAAGGAFLYVK